MEFREDIIRQEAADFHQLMEAVFDFRHLQARIKDQRQNVAIDLDRQVAAGEQVFHHLRMADIVGELLVPAAHAEGPRKFGRLQIDIVITNSLGNF